MRVVIVTQKIDREDTNLGFFIRWIEAFAEQCTEVVVIANEVQGVTLSRTIVLHSLGKENGLSRFQRLLRYRRLLRKELPLSDGIFFHMCPEYALAAGRLPRAFGKKSILWYVHKKVSLRLWTAALLVDAIFTASKESCRLNSRNVHIVGHGIDTSLPVSVPSSHAAPHFVTVGRIAPVKDVQTILLGFEKLRSEFEGAEISVIGKPITPKDHAYDARLRQRFVSPHIHFKSLPYGEAYNQNGYTAFLHASKTGSLDKAVLEALAAGLPVFTSSEAFGESIPGVTRFRESDSEDLAKKVVGAYTRGELGYNAEEAAWVREHHSLDRLVGKIIAFYSGFPLPRE